MSDAADADLRDMEAAVFEARLRALTGAQPDDSEARTVKGVARSRLPPYLHQSVDHLPDREHAPPIEPWPHQARREFAATADDYLNPFRAAGRAAEWARGAGNYAGNALVGGLSGGRTSAGQMFREAGDLVPAWYRPFGDEGVLRRIGNSTDVDAARWADQNKPWLEPAQGVGEFLLGGLGPAGQGMGRLWQGARHAMDRARAAVDRPDAQGRDVRAGVDAYNAAEQRSRDMAQGAEQIWRDTQRAEAEARTVHAESARRADADAATERYLAEARARLNREAQIAASRDRLIGRINAREAERRRTAEIDAELGVAVRNDRRAERDDRMSRPALPHFSVEENNALYRAQRERADSDAAYRRGLTGRERAVEDLEGEAFVWARSDPSRADRARDTADMVRTFRADDPGTTATSSQILRDLAIERTIEAARRRDGGAGFARGIDEASGYDPSSYDSTINSLSRSGWRLDGYPMPTYELQGRDARGRLQPMTRSERLILEAFRRREAERAGGKEDIPW